MVEPAPPSMLHTSFRLTSFFTIGASASVSPHVSLRTGGTPHTHDRARMHAGGGIEAKHTLTHIKCLREVVRKDAKRTHQRTG